MDALTVKLSGIEQVEPSVGNWGALRAVEMALLVVVYLVARLAGD